MARRIALFGQAAFGKDVLERLLAQRLPAYTEATYTVDTDGPGAEEIATEIARLVGLRYSR